MNTTFKSIVVALLASLLAGCINEIAVMTTKQWEGHYYTTEEAKTAVDNIELDDNESIWLLSNCTLKRLLDNTRK
jgi:uncharacterized protein involved in tolerance to divalent cations